MKKIAILILWLLWGLWICFGSVEYFDVDSSSTIKANVNEVVNTDWVGADPLRNWTNNVWTRINSPINEPILTSTYAQNRTVMVIKNAVNYFLGFLWLVALIFLLYNWFWILSAWWDDTKASNWYKGLNYSLYALFGVWFTWILVSFAIYLVNKFFTWA